MKLAEAQEIIKDSKNFSFSLGLELKNILFYYNSGTCIAYYIEFSKITKEEFKKMLINIENEVKNAK